SSLTTTTPRHTPKDQRKTTDVLNKTYGNGSIHSKTTAIQKPIFRKPPRHRPPMLPNTKPPHIIGSRYSGHTNTYGTPRLPKATCYGIDCFNLFRFLECKGHLGGTMRVNRLL